MRARYLLDCEGVTGALKRKLAPGPAQYITTFQTFNEGRIALDPHYFYAYLQPELSEYDAWFNVKDGFLVLGVSVRDAKRAEYFYRRFLSYMEERHGLCTGREERREKWLMPRIPPGCPIYYGQGRVLCAGEAAGFLRWRADIMRPARLWSIGMSRSAPWRATGNGRTPCGLTCGVNGVLPQAWRRRSGR